VKRFLIVGLGNPGKMYEGTRHNVGFALVQALAKKHGLKFRRETQWKASLAEGTILGSPVIIMMPLTFMNLSGEAVAPLMRYFDIEMSQILVAVDDIAIPLGQIRVRINSGSGGHNGLKSVEEHLQSNRYARLRVGVGYEGENLADYVLERFSKEEEKLIPEILERAEKAIEVWLEKGITKAMDFANPSNPRTSNEEE
jgi:PTH1 family peptidyl-tRNA hydrolase